MDAVPIAKKLIAFGSNKIYLPKFTVALVRTPKLSPYHARFLVPLDFSKYDLRDYLFHAYNVKCFNIRSYVKQMPVRDTQERPRNWFRPESQKYMTVEMEQPFVWPETPSLEPWGKNEREKEIAASAKANGAVSAEDQRNMARTLREQARALLHKRDAATNDLSIEQKQAQGLEKETEKQRLPQEKEASHLSSIEIWEQRRTEKVVQSDENDRFTIKA